MEKVVNTHNLENFYKGKSVFITGHTGFKGSWLSAWLYQLGAKVYGYALAPEYSNPIYDALFKTGICNECIGDIRDQKRLSFAIEQAKPEFIFHLAAQPLVRKSYAEPVETFDVNVIGTAGLLNIIKNLDHTCTTLVITTDKVYENIEQDVLYKESDRLGGHDPYSASKACTELVVQSFLKSFYNQINTKQLGSARAGNVIGGGDFSTDRIIPDIIRSFKKGEAVEVRNPKAIRPWQHVLEPLFGYLQLAIHLAEEKIEDPYFNFGPTKEGHLSVKELLDLAVKAYGSGTWEHVKTADQPHEANILQLDISKAADSLGWHPKLDAETAIQWTIDWYKKNPEEQYAFTKSQIENYMQL